MWRFALVVGLALAGCFSANETVCADGTVCPDKKVCAPAGGACVDQEQIDACQGIADGGGCQLTTVGHGVCRGGLCVAVGGCGDCVVEAGEACDDCNTMSGDGCRADCQKIEMCGDGVVDEGEACDDANQDPSDGCDMCRATEWLATPILGGNAQPLQTLLENPTDIAIDRNGNVFIADAGNHRVLRLDRASGAIVTVAGNGLDGTSGDGGPATSAQLSNISGLAVDGLGNLMIALGSGIDNRIRRVDATTGIITNIAGVGQFDGPMNGGFGDGGLATNARIRGDDVAVDGLGNVYIAEEQAQIVRRVDPATGIITTYAGVPTTGGPSGDSSDGVLATTAQLQGPHSLALDSANNLYIGENGLVRKVDAATGKIYTVAGTGIAGETGDGGNALAAQIDSQVQIAIDGSNNLFISEQNGNRVRRVTPAGTIDTIAGTGLSGDTGDGGSATAATLGQPHGIAADPGGNVWIAESSDSVVREVHHATGTIDRQIGSTTVVLIPPYELTSTHLAYPNAVAADAQGRPYLALDGFVVRLDPTGPTIVAGSLTGGGLGDGGPATQASISVPHGLAFDGAGNLYLSDTFANRIRKVAAATGIITTIAGNGTTGFSGDGGSAVAAALNSPTDIAADANGTVYFIDDNNHRIRKIAGGIITTVAGNGAYAFSADGANASSRSIDYPEGITVDASGNLYIAESSSNLIRKVDAAGNLTTVAGNGVYDSTGDGGQALQAAIHAPTDVHFDASGRMVIVEGYFGIIRRVDTSGIISTIAGGGSGRFGDMGPALGAGLSGVTRAALDPQGEIFLIDYTFDSRLRKIAANGTVSTLFGQVEPAGMGPSLTARAIEPGALAITPAGVLIAGGTSGTVQALTATKLEAVIGRYLQDVPTGNLARYRDAISPPIGGLAFDAASNIVYVALGNEIDAVTMVDPANPDTWTIATVAGGASAGYAVGDGATQVALFSAPAGLAFDSTAHALYVADTGNNVVRAVNLQTGVAPTVAGTPRTLGYAGDGGDATLALLNGPTAVTLCGSDLFIADTANNRVRRVAGGTITTVIGDGVPGSSGQGSPASQFPVNGPRGLVCDALGNLFVTSTNSVRLLAADATGVVDGTGPVETIYGAPPRDVFPEPVTRCLAGVVVVDDKTVRVSDSCTGMLIDLVRQVKP